MPQSHTLSLPAARVPTFEGSPNEDAAPAVGAIPTVTGEIPAPISGTNASGSATTRTRFGGTVQWIGNATCIIEYAGVRFMTDPNFLHAGDHVHLGPGVTATRQHDPAFPYTSCPPVDFILLSHLHDDHFDSLVAKKLRRDIPIVSTTAARDALVTPSTDGTRGFTNVIGLDTWDVVRVAKPLLPASGADLNITITAMPGKHTLGVIDKLNEILNAIPPVMGSLIEFSTPDEGTFTLYISGDTLYYDELKEIHRRYPHINLALIHLGGTTLPVVQVMVTMDAEQGIKLLCALKPDTVIPIHFDDYNVFKSSLDDFKKAVGESEFKDKVVYLGRGEKYEW